VRKGISNSQVDRGLVEIVREHNETGTKSISSPERPNATLLIYAPSLHLGGVLQDRLESAEGLGTIDLTSRDPPVVGIEDTASGGTTPHDGNHAHSQRDSTNTVIC
jgi:hypothetical protein